MLYREGLAQQLDKGDPAIRDRVIFKALSVIETGLKLPPLDDALLRDWFEQHRVKYDEPARYDYQEAVLPGEPARADLELLAAALNSGKPGESEGEPARLHGSTATATSCRATARPSRRRSKRRRVSSGACSTARMARGSFSSKRSRRRGRRSSSALRGVVLQDWTDATMAEQRTAVVRSLAKKYTVSEERAMRRSAPGCSAARCSSRARRAAHEMTMAELDLRETAPG